MDEIGRWAPGHPLPLADGRWRGPDPGGAEGARRAEASGWRAEAPLADGSWAWRPLGPSRPPEAGAHPAVARLELARAAVAAPLPTRPRWFAILNLTPDSFSDGGALLGRDGAPDATALRERAAGLRRRGAEVLDLGAESTRPGAAPTPPELQLERLLLAIEALRPLGLPISVDTRSAAVAAACLDAGAEWINDVSGLQHDPEMASLAAGRGCRVVIMHMRGDPATMRSRSDYRLPLGEIADELAARVRRGLEAGMNSERMVLDPGIGFAKDAARSAALAAGLGALRALGLPLMAGPSRKSFLSEFGAAPAGRDAASAGVAALCAAQGAEWLRLHDGAGWDGVLAAAACARAARAEAG